MNKKIGDYSFIAGVILAIVLGLSIPALEAAASLLFSLLILLGLVVGFLNIRDKETKEFLWVSVALAIVAYTAKTQIDSWQDIPLIGTYLKDVFGNILAFIVPASIVVALRTIWGLAKSG